MSLGQSPVSIKGETGKLKSPAIPEEECADEMSPPSATAVFEMAY
jgi:hypothetical protein